jgi:D-inositol-3-phosphate glycosyltransferase
MEGLSLALLDAMGAGLCVVASDVPENSRSGRWMPDTLLSEAMPSDLADRLSFLIANPAVRAAAGRTAKKRIEEQYQWQGVAEEIENVYFRVMGRKATDARAKKPNARVVAVGESEGEERRAG